MADVELKQLCKSFDGVEILHNVSIDIRDGEFVVIVGPSGCGKSTLLRMIAGLEDPTSGAIWIDREQVDQWAPARRGIAMVFQSYALYPHMSVFKNMAFGLEVAKYTKAEIEDRVRRAARILELEPFLDRRPKELSGGQRQRVAIGRAIVRNPKVFLFDEPLSNLDAALRVKMRLELAKLHNDLKATTIFVTHDQVEAMTLATKIVVMREGRVEQIGTPLQLYRRPVNQFVAGFIGSPSMNFLACEVVAREGNATTIRLSNGETLRVPVKPGTVVEGDKVTLGVRPEHFVDDDKHAAEFLVHADVFAVERLGGETFLYVRVGGETLVVQAAGNSRTRVGDAIAIGLRGDACHLFDEGGRAFEHVDDETH
jgi:multiple sugar transport system ATP-binding protein